MTRAPTLGVSTAVFRGDGVLLVRRAKPPFANAWSLPGGALEWGETSEAAARREVCEETGLTLGELRFVTYHDIVLADAHVVILVFAAACEVGDPTAGDDALEARFIHRSALSSLETTPRLGDLVETAQTTLKADMYPQG